MKVVVVFHIPEIEMRADSSYPSMVLRCIGDFLSPFGYKWQFWKIVNDGDKEDIFDIA